MSYVLLFSWKDTHTEMEEVQRFNELNEIVLSEQEKYASALRKIENEIRHVQKEIKELQNE